MQHQKNNWHIYSGLGINESGKFSSTAIPELLNQLRSYNEIRGQNADFVYFNKTDMINIFDIDSVAEDDAFIINFKTREVVSQRGVEYKNRLYHTQYAPSLIYGQRLVYYEDNTSIPDFSVIKWQKGSTIDLIINYVTVNNAKIAYRNVDNNSSWITAIENTSKNEEYVISINISGNYELKITDVNGNSNSKTTNIVLCNEPKLTEDLTPSDPARNVIEIQTEVWYDYSDISSRWAFAKNRLDELYLWIPRFAFNSTLNDIKFLKGYSNIPLDNSNISYEGEDGWELKDKFINPNQITGIWVQMRNTDDLENIDLNQIINSITGSSAVRRKSIIVY